MTRDDTLQAICNRFRARVRSLLIGYGLLQTVFLLLAVAMALVVCDWYFRFSPNLRMLSLLTLLSLTALGAYAGLGRPFRRMWSDEQVLAYIDRTVPEGQDALTTLHDLSHPERMREWETDEGKQIVGSVVTTLSAKAETVDVARLLRRQPVRRWQWATGLLVVFYLIGFTVPRDRVSGSSYLGIGLRRLFYPYGSVFWPQKTRILVQEPDSGWRVPRGEPLLIRAKIDGEVPPVVEIVYQSKSSTVWITERMAVNAKAAEATFRFSEMTEPMTFYCMGGDDRERRRFSVTVAERPVITSIKAFYSYPPYMRLPNKIASHGQIQGPEGTDVKLEFTASANLAKATIQFAFEGEAPQQPVEIPDLSGSTFSYAFRLSRSGTYTLELTDRNQLKNGKPERYEIRVDPDAPPEITLEEPIRDVLLTARGKIRVTFKAKDDYNIEELNVMVGPVGGTGTPLSDKITGPLLPALTTHHPVGEGDFDLDFLKEKDRGVFKNMNLEEGVDLELWVRARDCNPSGKGVSESLKVHLSILRDTEFMEAVVLKAKELTADARVGWYAAAGASADARKWLKEPTNDKLLGEVLDGQQAAERAAAALSLRYGEIVQHMQRNRMQDLFMSKRLDRIGSKISELSAWMPEVAKKIAAGQPASSEEAEPTRRRAKMAQALQTALPDINKAAWQMRLLYDRLADWVALQSVLLKTRRIEEMQRTVNDATDAFVKKTLGREARELDDAEVREMKELGSQQQTVYDMEEAVEKELKELILQADRDKRFKVWEALARAFKDLRDNRVNDKLKQAAVAILDARADVVRKDQKLVLESVSFVNKGLIAAGEQVPNDPPPETFLAAIDDPRGRTDVVAKIEEDKGTEAVDERAYTGLGERQTHLAEAKADTLEETLDQIIRQQEDVRNRTLFVAERSKCFPRYVFLRTGLLGHRQGVVTNLLAKAFRQVSQYGQPAAATTTGASAEPDPTREKIRRRLATQVKEYAEQAGDVTALIAESHFGPLVTGIQTHLFRGAHDLRVFMQETERLHTIQLDRKASGFKDVFDRNFLLRENNLAVVIDAAKDLEWSLVLQAAAQREAELLAGMKSWATRQLSQAAKATIVRLAKNSQAKNVELVGLIGKVQQTITGGVTDPTDPERENERVLPHLQNQVLSPLAPKEFHDALRQFEKRDFSNLALKQETLRRTLSSILVSLRDLLEERVRPPKVVEEAFVASTITEAEGGYEYEDELPPRVALLIEKEAEWIDKATGDPEIRKALVKRLQSMEKWDSRYGRLQSTYFQALAHNFTARAKKDKDLVSTQQNEKKKSQP